MQFTLLVVLVVLILLFAQAGMTLPAFIVVLLLFADIIGGYATKFLSSIWGIITGLLETGRAEFDELEKTRTKAPTGKKFLEEGLERTGKAIGKGEATKKQRKRTEDKRDDAEKIATAITDFMSGLGKLFKK